MLTSCPQGRRGGTRLLIETVALLAMVIIAIIIALIVFKGLVVKLFYSVKDIIMKIVEDFVERISWIFP